MRTALRKLTGIRVNSWLFLLACLLLAGFGVTAKLMADQVVLETDRAARCLGAPPVGVHSAK